MLTFIALLSLMISSIAGVCIIFLINEMRLLQQQVLDIKRRLIVVERFLDTSFQ